MCGISLRVGAWTHTGLPDVLTYSFISFLAFAGIGWAIRDVRYDTVPLLIPLIFFPIVYYLTHTDIRFRHPIDPLVVIFVVYGVISFRWQRVENVLGKAQPMVLLEESIRFSAKLW